MTIDSLMQITKRPETIFSKGKGDYLYDTDNAPYLDWIQGWAVNSLGHSHPKVVSSLKNQAQALINCSPAFYSQPMLDLANLLVKHSFADQVFFANSGAEANEGAIKLARKWGKINKQGAYEIISFQNSFHGRTLATMAATGKDNWQSLFPPNIPGFKKAIYNSIDSVITLVNEKTVAVMLELVQGEGGVIAADPQFIDQLYSFCKKNNLLFIVDEVQTGIGRCGSLFCYEQYSITPDIMTLGKGLGSGPPIAALLGQEAICCFEPGEQGGTFNGNALICAVAQTVVSEINRPIFLIEVKEKSSYFQSQLAKLCDKHKGCIWRGKGLLLAIELSQPIAFDLANKAYKKQFLINAPKENLLRFMPALTITYEAIDQGVNILDELLCQLL